MPASDLTPERQEQGVGLSRSGKRDTVSSLSIADLVDVWVRRWRVWFWTPAVLAGLAVVISLILPAHYRSYASFVPETSQGQAGGMGLLQASSLAGLDLSALTGANSGPAFYVELLRSRTVRREVVLSRYEDREHGFSGDLVAFFRLSDVQPHAKAVEKAISRLADASQVSADPVSGLVTITAMTRSREMSERIIARYMGALEDFNQNRRSLHTKARVRFLEAQVDSARDDLRTAEDSLERFLEQNRTYSNSPSLLFQHDRLQRRVDIRTAIVQQLQQQYEQAGLDLVASIPTVSVVDQPVVPQQRASPKRTLIVVSTGFIGLVIGLLFALMLEGWEQIRQAISPASRERLESLKRRFATLRRSRMLGAGQRRVDQ